MVLRHFPRLIPFSYKRPVNCVWVSVAMMGRVRSTLFRQLGLVGGLGWGRYRFLLGIQFPRPFSSYEISQPHSRHPSFPCDCNSRHPLHYLRRVIYSTTESVGYFLLLLFRGGSGPLGVSPLYFIFFFSFFVGLLFFKCMGCGTLLCFVILFIVYTARDVQWGKRYVSF